jgi:arginyl-tRNA synthetase
MTNPVPFQLFEEECYHLLRASLGELTGEAMEVVKRVLTKGLEVPPSKELGELAFPCFELAKALGRGAQGARRRPRY